MSHAPWVTIAAVPLRCHCGQILPMPEPNSYIVCPVCATRYWTQVLVEEELVIGHRDRGHALYDQSRINGKCPACAFAELSRSP